MTTSTAPDQTSPGAWRRTGAVRVAAGVAMGGFAVTYRPLAGHPAPRTALVAGLVLSAIVVVRGAVQWVLAPRATDFWTIGLLWLDAHLILGLSLAFAFDPRSFPYVLLPVVWAETAAASGLTGGLLLWAESSAVFSAIEVWAASAFGVEAEPIGLLLRAAVGLVFVLLAVSLVRRSEEHRRQRVSMEERYRSLVERIPAVTYLRATGPGRTTTYMSPQARDLLGYPPSALLRESDLWHQRIHPDDRARVLDAERRAVETSQPFACEYRSVRPDGRVLWVHDEAAPVRGEDGSITAWQGFVYDVSERLEAERRILAAEERFRNLVERLPAVTYIETADEQRTVYVSPQVETILGYRPDEWAAAAWKDSVHPEDRAMVAAADERCDETGEPFACEYRVFRGDGSLAWLHDEAVLVRDESGRPVHWQGVMFDITERHDAEEEVRRALAIERDAAARLRALDEMKTTFLHAVSHELRTPLAAILGYAVTLERQELELGPEEGAALLQRLAANARKLDRLLSDLLDLDRLDRGVMEPRRRPTDLGALVRQVVQETGLLEGRPLHLGLDPVVVAVEPAKVERIVENLIANTVRHTASETPVWVWVHPFDRGAVLAVEDGGAGVPVEFRHSIFEPFRQGPGIPAHSPGVGIGLSLVARFAELHGGRAWVEERPGGGASFRVYLPEPEPTPERRPDAEGSDARENATVAITRVAGAAP